MTPAVAVEERTWPSVRRPKNRSAKLRLPPAVILDGDANALSIARSLSLLGIQVFAVGPKDSRVRHSRHIRWITTPPARGCDKGWIEYLLGPKALFLHGAVLLPAGDAAIQTILKNREELAQRYLLEEMNPQARQCMLDKRSTYQAARSVNVPTPRFWLAKSREQIEALRDALVFPLLVKPLLSHVFEERYGRKFFVADSFDALRAVWDGVHETGIETMLVEWIPGLDDNLCSYYTYLDAQGEPLFHFTKRVIRRNPPGMGGACYHVTDWIPDLREPSLRLLQAVGLRGLANVEFKRDPRDGILKLIECNARFTASNCLIERAGFDLARFVYSRIVGLPHAPLVAFETGLRLWFPVEDFHAFQTMRRQGEITWRQWLASISFRQSFPYFDWRDPLPTIVDELRRLKRGLSRKLPSLSTWLSCRP